MKGGRLGGSYLTFSRDPQMLRSVSAGFPEQRRGSFGVVVALRVCALDSICVSTKAIIAGVVCGILRVLRAEERKSFGRGGKGEGGRDDSG
jgi:hypothetical protein